VIIRGEGERAFCAGGDVRTVYENGIERANGSLQFFRTEYAMNQRIFDFPKPYVALMHGITMGGGLGVSVHGSHRVGDENLIMAMPETGIGFFPDVGGTYFLSHMQDSLGVYLGLTGVRMTVKDAVYVGLVDHIIPTRHFDEVVNSLQKVLEKDSNIKDTITTVLNNFSESVTEASLEKNIAEIAGCFEEKSVVDIIQNLTVRKSDWSEITLNVLKQKSPTSLVVTLIALHNATKQDFHSCMETELRLTEFFLHQPDFYEGVRAAVVDKDRTPIWHPDQVDAVEIPSGLF